MAKQKQPNMRIRFIDVVLHSPNPLHVAAKQASGCGIHGDLTRRTERRRNRQDERRAKMFMQGGDD